MGDRGQQEKLTGTVTAVQLMPGAAGSAGALSSRAWHNEHGTHSKI